MFNESRLKKEERDFVNKYGYASYEAMNNDDPNLVILEDNKLKGELSSFVYDNNEIISENNSKKVDEKYNNKEEVDENQVII